MKKFKYILLLTLSLVLTVSCEDNEWTTDATDYVTFETTSMDVDLLVGTTQEVIVKVYASQVASSDRTIMISASEDSTFDPAAHTLPESVTIPSGSNEADLVFEIADINFGASASLIIDFDAPDGFYIGESIQINISKICDVPAVLNFTFDGYASECTWDIKDSSGNVLAAGGPWSDGTASAMVEVCLASGDYTLTAYDSWGDGLTWPNLGNIAVSYNGTELAVLPGDYGSEGSLPFTIPN